MDFLWLLTVFSDLWSDKKETPTIPSIKPSDSNVSSEGGKHFEHNSIQILSFWFRKFMQISACLIS